MVGGRQLAFDAEDLAIGYLKGRNELCSPVRYNRVGQAMQFVDMPIYKLGGFFGRGAPLACPVGYKVPYLGEPIGDGEDSIIAL